MFCLHKVHYANATLFEQPLTLCAEKKTAEMNLSQKLYESALNLWQITNEGYS